jgi:uncharacterized protein (TIGR02246 family)
MERQPLSRSIPADDIVVWRRTDIYLCFLARVFWFTPSAITPMNTTTLRGTTISLAAITLAVSPLASQVEDGGGSQREVRTTIERINADVVRWYAAGQADSVATAFASDARQMGPNSEPLVGRDAIRDFWRDALGWGKWTFELTTEDVRVSGPLAIERGIYKVAFVPGAGGPPGMPAFTDEGSYLVQWEFDDGAWRIVNDIATSRLPPPGTQ